MKKRVLDNVLSGSFILLVVLMVGFWPKKTESLSADQIIPQFKEHWSELKKNNLVTGTILIEKEGRIVFAEGSTEKKYPIASLSKSFVGYSFFLLQKKGFDLDQKACQWLPHFCHSQFADITIRHLLQHKGGLGRDLSFIHFLKRSFQEDWDLGKIDQINLENESLKSEAGKKFIYSNFGYLVLSRILEKIHGQSFSEIVKSLAYQNGLKNTSVISKGDSFERHLLVPFTNWEKVWSQKSGLYNSFGTGGIQSSASDMIRWLQVLEKSKFQEEIFIEKTNYSHGWVKSKKQKYQASWHNGATIGFYTLAASIPDEKIRIVILTDNFKPIQQWSLEVENFENHFY